MSKFTPIDLNNFEGRIPSGSSLVVTEGGVYDDKTMELHGFDEIGMFRGFKKPVYGFLTND